MYKDNCKGLKKGIFSLDLAPEGNFQQAQADMLALMIGDLENMLNAGSALEDPGKKVDLSAIYFVLHNFFIV